MWEKGGGSRQHEAGSRQSATDTATERKRGSAKWALEAARSGTLVAGCVPFKKKDSPFWLATYLGSWGDSVARSGTQMTRNSKVGPDRYPAFGFWGDRFRRILGILASGIPRVLGVFGGRIPSLF